MPFSLFFLFPSFLLRTFSSSAFLLSVLLNSFLVVVLIPSTSFQIFFFQFVIVPSSPNQLPVLLLAYRTTRSMSRCVLPIIFSILCPWQGKGLPLSDGKREGRASRRCDLDGCSHLEGVRATARNTQVSSASDTCPVL